MVVCWHYCPYHTAFVLNCPCVPHPGIDLLLPVVCKTDPSALLQKCCGVSQGPLKVQRLQPCFTSQRCLCSSDMGTWWHAESAAYRNLKVCRKCSLQEPIESAASAAEVSWAGLESDVLGARIILFCFVTEKISRIFAWCASLFFQSKNIRSSYTRVDSSYTRLFPCH